MKKLILRVAKRPNTKAPASTRTTQLPSRILKKIFGTTNPEHRVAIILPGHQISSIDLELQTPTADYTKLISALKKHPANNQRADKTATEVVER